MGNLIAKLTSLRGQDQCNVYGTASNLLSETLSTAPAHRISYAAGNLGSSTEILLHGIKCPSASQDRPLGGILKRTCDVIGSLLAIILLSPLIVFTYALVRFFIGAPALFAHRRVGFNGASFTCYKFRTMILNSEEALAQHLANDQKAAREWYETQKLRDDPRVCSFGKILRKSSLDELPQLFNVLRGDMSLIGPRPIVPSEIKRYGRYVCDYLKARPGLSGLWQVNGRNSLSYSERIALDRYYVRRWRLSLDLEILLKTAPAILRTTNTT